MTNQTFSSESQQTLEQWRQHELKAMELMQIASALRFDRGIELVIFREDVYDARPSDLLHYHTLAQAYTDADLTIDHTLSLVKAIQERSDTLPMKLDIGIMCCDYLSSGENDLVAFVHKKLNETADNHKGQSNARDVVLYGFGRIGRLLARRIISTTGRGDQLRLKAIVLRSKLADRQLELEKRAGLLMEDSIHGRFPGTVVIDAENSTLTVNGNLIHVIYASGPEEIDYRDYGINDALVIDNTGVWRDHQGLSQHLRPGVAQVILTAPGKDIPNIVYGINQREALIDGTKVISAASCTTNAIVPVIKVLDDHIGVQQGHIETVHAYTSDQNLLDNFHKKPRRGRGAATNMVLTSTGAASAVAKVLPHLAGAFTGNAVRVPTPDVSIAIMSFTLNRETSVEEVNDLMKNASLHGELVEQLHYSSSSEFVSSNAIGMTCASIFDAPSTLISKDRKRVTVYAWYDNEYGYTCQVVRLAKYFAHVRRPHYY